MDPSNWINLAATVASVGAAVTAGIFALRSNVIQKRLLDIEEQRNLLDLTPNISAARVNLHDTGRLLSVEISLTNLGQHTVHILAVAVFDTESNDLLAVGRQNCAVQSSQLIDVDFGAEPVPMTSTDREGGITVSTVIR